MVMLDLDGLKSVNDTYGHESGDIYIRETAVCMKGIPEDHAIVGRRSGDEFFILLFGYEDRNGVRETIEGISMIFWINTQPFCLTEYS
ncbi:MAG: diguanylate cyclase domain-containing protein [Acutalibacteraceae bacterium]